MQLPLFSVRAPRTPGGLQGQGPRRPLHEWPTVKSASVESPRTMNIYWDYMQLWFYLNDPVTIMIFDTDHKRPTYLQMSF